MKRTEWFRAARFGMFIHWGLYAIPARGEWVKSTERMCDADYDRYFDAFDPKDCNPAEWVRLAKKAGMKYVVLTAKHHDGFCLFDSKLTDYKTTNTKLGRDIVREFVDACREEDMGVGLYFSLIDWKHPDYPKYADLHHPMRGNPAVRDEVIDFERYLAFMHAQVEELVTSYGKIDILWFDFSYGEMSYEKWGASKLIQMVRKHQPHVIIDNRLEASGEALGSVATPEINDFAGDFVSPEQVLPPQGVVNFEGRPIPWELCTTLNNSWGYTACDHDYKSPKMLVRKLVECVSKGGNMLLNVSPDANGRIDANSCAILHRIGDWMARNSASLRGAGIAALPKPEWGYYTQRGNTLYAHILDGPLGPLPLLGLRRDEIVRMTWLHDGSEAKISDSWALKAYGDVVFVQMGQVPHFTYAPADDVDTVLAIQLKDAECTERKYKETK